MSLVVAQQYAKLLAYKDEYEVARLLADPALRREIEAAFEPGARLSFNMAPPLLGGRPVNGRPPKRSFGAWWMRPLLGCLARMKGLRGTRIDPFGWSAERRMERGLIAEYEALVDHVLTHLTPANHAAAETLLGLADSIRGFGPVKSQAVSAYQDALPAVRQAFDAQSLDKAA